MHLPRAKYGGQKMLLKLYYHPFASYCHKVLIALYENGTAFEGMFVNPGEPEQRAAFQKVWPLAKMPVLQDEARGRTIVESSPMIHYLDHHYPGPAPLIPADPDVLVEVQIMDRLFDNYLATPLTKIVTDNFRPEGKADPQGVEEARALIASVYPILDERLAHGGWSVGHDFSLADCAAAPALFYANTAVPFAQHRNVASYYERLLARPSFARVVEEARPYRHLFPLPWPESYA